MRTSIISVDDLYYAYPGNEVLKGISFALQPASVLCLAGPNGCGKTTLLDCLLGSRCPDKGRIDVDGLDPMKDSPRKLARHIAYVPQTHEKTFPYTVLQIVLMGRTPHISSFSGPSHKDRRKCRQVLEQMGIAHLENRPYTRLSGGECQLVMLARALAQEAQVIVMDEPTAHLDYHNEILFLETLIKQIGLNQVAVLMATHAPNHAFYLHNAGVQTEIAMMAGGVFQACGNPVTVLTEENVRMIYGIDSRIVELPAGQGQIARHLIATGLSIDEERMCRQ